MNLHLPRGIRNNNPGNIRHSAAKWQGQKNDGFDPAFVEFIDPAFGIRALMKILLTYYFKFQLDTVQSIVNRWAPPHENATDHYAMHVARRLGCGRLKKIDVSAPETLIELAKAIVVHENGPGKPPCPEAWYPDHLYRTTAMTLTKKEKDA